MSDIVIEIIKCPLCGCETLILFTRDDMDSRKHYYYNCGSCDFENTLRISTEHEVIL